jgi:hypothetical protein
MMALLVMIAPCDGRRLDEIAAAPAEPHVRSRL